MPDTSSWPSPRARHTQLPLSGVKIDRLLKDESLRYREEAERDRKSMNRQWGELANRLGTLVEDIVAPNLPKVARDLLGCPQPDLCGVRMRRCFNGDGQGVLQLRLALDGLQAQGATLVFVTHDVDLAYPWPDEVVILVVGRLLRQGDPAEILGDPELLAAAGLTMPMLLQLAGALCRTRSWPDGRAPRTAEALIALLSDPASADRPRV
ncbi:hypothetical protein [Thiocapsa sp.]|uniref:hypothetical protein n=1 Tax=Thiocapsa sp. TaxID=2024551 RepID=UPI0035936207